MDLVSTHSKIKNTCTYSTIVIYFNTDYIGRKEFNFKVYNTYFSIILIRQGFKYTMMQLLYLHVKENDTI